MVVLVLLYFYFFKIVLCAQLVNLSHDKKKGGTYNSKRNSKQARREGINKNDVISKETFSSQSEIDYISPPVMRFIDMVLLNGLNVDTSDKKRSSSALTIAQLLQFNTVKQNEKKANLMKHRFHFTWV